jgi:hypothetical protein
MRDARGEIVYLPGATVIHSYRRESRERPLPRHALRHLRAFVALQWRYRRRRRELDLLAAELDRRAEAAR